MTLLTGESRRFGFAPVFFIDGPNRLSDEEWAARFKELEWIRREEAKGNRS